MKSTRHAKILELVRKYEIETQEELSEWLLKEGYAVTQATVSRDIRELRLTKVMKSGKQMYAVLNEENRDLSEKYIRIFGDGFLSMDSAQNILVIKTVPGMAMAVAAALDHMDCHEVVGSIAGDDTVMCAIRTVEDTKSFMERLRKLLEANRKSLSEETGTLLLER